MQKMKDDAVTGGSPSDITPLKTSLLDGAKPSMETQRPKEVRFSGVDPIPQNEEGHTHPVFDPVPHNEEGHTHPVSDPVNALEKFNELLTKLQVDMLMYPCFMICYIHSVYNYGIFRFPFYTGTS